MLANETVTLLVNGNSHAVSADPRTPLLYVLRNELGLKGPKFGCGSEQCGACKVLVDGSAVPSCQLPIAQVDGLRIVTVEGLGGPDDLHPLQEAFIEAQAAQCGYCTAGMIIAAEGLLNHTRYPTDEDIRAALEDNLCRCGAYERVRRAIRLRIARPDAEPLYQTLTSPPEDAEPVQASGELPRSLQKSPALDDWLRFDGEEETVMVFTGKVELGQGIVTALAQIVAEELDVALHRLHVVSGDTARTPDEGGTTGSMSLQTSGAALRLAAAEARHILLGRAFEELEAPSPEALEVEDGVIRDPASGRETTYWRLMGGRRFGQTIGGRTQPKAAGRHAVVGQAAGRLALVDIVTGRPTFVHDLALPDMVHGRVIRPPGYHARLTDIDETAARQMPGVLHVVRDGSFLGVIAESEAQAVLARAALRQATTWQTASELPPAESVFERLLQGQSRAYPVVEGTAIDEPAPTPPPEAENGLSATYYRPYQMHAALGPSSAVALMEDDKLTIWSHTQAVFTLQATVAEAMGLDPETVRVIHVPGAGCYGHNGADDAALDAALLARAVPGRPVSLKWMRDDEHAWEPYGPAMAIRLSASLDEEGMIAAWRHDGWSYPHVGRPRAGGSADSSGLLATWHLARPFARPQPRQILGSHFGAYRNADPLYTFPRQIVDHFVAGSPLRTSSLRSLGAYANVFALESFMDELAQAAGQDPLAFRLAHLADERARAVLQAAATSAGWEPRPRPAGQGQGRGLAFARYKNRAGYAAVVMDVGVDRQSGEISLQRAVIAADVGEIVNPDGLSNQLEGGLVQAASWTLYEEVQFDAEGITSCDWDSYPILRFPAAPRVQTILLDRPGLPFLGSGEVVQGPTPAAIANAVFDATGARLRCIPFTPQRVRAAL